MIDPVTTLSMLGRVMFSYAFLFILLPAFVVRVDEEDRGVLSRLFIYLIHAHAFFIMAVHLLASIKVYETISIVLLTVAVLLLASRLQTKGNYLTPSRKSMVYIFELFDDKNRWKQEWRKGKSAVHRCIAALWHSLLGRVRSHPFMWLGIAIAFVWAACQRFFHAFSHYYFASADPYVHITWAKYIGANQMYVDGVYPYGFESVLSALSKFFISDPYMVVRFVGAIAGMLIVTALFFFLNKNSRGHLIVPFVGTLVYVAGTGLPVVVWRQLSALSMEYSMIFLLPGIHFLYRYLRAGKRTHLFLAAECLMIVTLIHAFTAACLGIAYVVVCLVLLPSRWKAIFSVRFLGVMGTAGVIGVAPMLAGLLSGLHFHAQTMKYVSGSVKLAAEMNKGFTESTPVFLAIWVFSAGIILYAAIRSLRERRTPLEDRKSPYGLGLIMAVSTVVLYAMYRAKNIGLPEFMPEERLGVFLSLVAASFIGLVMLSLAQLFEGRRGSGVWRSLLAAIATALILVSSNYSYRNGDQYQYDEAVQQYLQIRKELPYPHNWLVIGTMEEGNLVRDYGYHTNLTEFVKSLQPNEKGIRFLSNDVFLFVEKTALGAKVSFTEEDAKQPFPELPDNKGATAFYYRDPNNRTILMAKAYEWAEKFRRSHSEMTVFYDSPVLRIYRIHHSEASPQFILK